MPAPDHTQVFQRMLVFVLTEDPGGEWVTIAQWNTSATLSSLKAYLSKCLNHRTLQLPVCTGGELSFIYTTSRTKPAQSEKSQLKTTKPKPRDETTSSTQCQNSSKKIHWQATCSSKIICWVCQIEQMRCSIQCSHVWLTIQTEQHTFPSGCSLTTPGHPSSSFSRKIFSSARKVKKPMITQRPRSFCCWKLCPSPEEWEKSLHVTIKNSIFPYREKKQQQNNLSLREVGTKHIS